jgi:ATP-binding cassette subfamily A (ABC1) protein 3
VFPAFYSFYVCKERRSLVQEMQFSNGLANPGTPEFPFIPILRMLIGYFKAGLWIGHLLFDSVFTIILSVIIADVFATCSNQFHGLGFFVSCLDASLCSSSTEPRSKWFLIVLYGIVGALFAYCAALLVVSPLAAFALVAGYQVVMFLVRTESLAVKWLN